MQPNPIQQTIDWLKSNPTNRVKGVYATNDAGDWRPPDADDATCFCTMGYLLHVGNYATEWDILDRNPNVASDEIGYVIQSNDEDDIAAVIQIMEGWLK